MEEHWARFFSHLSNRLTSGPLHFRLFIQPAMAILFAIRDGVQDARSNKPPFLWGILSRPSTAKTQLASAFRSIGKIFIAAIVIDAVYQLVVSKWFYPGEALWVAFVLAFWPYVLMRGPAQRLAKWWQEKSQKQTISNGQRF